MPRPTLTQAIRTLRSTSTLTRKSERVYDVVKCTADAPKFGFSNFYSTDSLKGKLIEVDGLAQAAEHRNRKALIVLRDYAFDEGAIKLVAEKKSACFLIDLGRIIRSRGVPRAILLSKLRTFLKLCVKHGAFYAFASFADKESQIRTADELIAIAGLLGINRGQAKFALRMLKHYLQENQIS